MDKEQFASGLKAIGVSDPLVIDQYFNAFDKKKDGTIEFLEFVTGLSVVNRGTMDERLECKMQSVLTLVMFRAYDSDGNGVLTPDEVFNMFKATTSTQGKKCSREELWKMVNDCFKKVDTDDDGSISLEEFKTAVNSQQLVVDCFVNLPY